MLNANEQKVFDALVDSSNGNGHDFGCLEDITGPWGTIEGMTNNQIGGYITALQSKALIDVFPPEYMVDHGHNVTQFYITNDGFRLAGLDDEVGHHGIDE